MLYGNLRIPGSAAAAHIAVCIKAVATTHVSGGDRAAGGAAGPGTSRLSLFGRTTGASSPLFFCDFQFLRGLARFLDGGIWTFLCDPGARFVTKYAKFGR